MTANETAALQTFTPGPWAISGDRDEDGLIITGESTGGVIAHIESTFGYAEADALNARLISAAPDLLEALAYAMFLIKESPGANENYRAAAQRKAEAAIDKARGE